MSAHAYRLVRPDVQRTSVVFASPHSGRNYDDHFLNNAVLDAHTLRSSEDAFVDMLFDTAPDVGAPFLTAVAPRAWVDLNRASEELDPALIEGVRRTSHNPRVSSGLGVIPRVVSNGRAIYSGKMPLSEAQARLERVWHPYHDKLTQLLEDTGRLFGEAILIDCHSMPHEAVANHTPRHRKTPDVVLGDRYGASADPRITAEIEHLFTCEGLTVARNTPFAGAYVAQQYGRPSRGQHVIQIEIDRSLYMDESTIQPNDDFAATKDMMARVVAGIAGLCESDMPMAAE